MHELGVTRSIVDVVLRNAQAQQAKQVLSVSLVIGEMRNLEEEWVQRYFDRCAKGTLAEGAKIKIQGTYGVLLQRLRVNLPTCHGQRQAYVLPRLRKRKL